MHAPFLVAALVLAPALGCAAGSNDPPPTDAPIGGVADARITADSAPRPDSRRAIDAGPTVCAPHGTGNVNGSAVSIAISTVQSVSFTRESGGFPGELTIKEDSSSCSITNEGEETLSFLYPCGPATAQRYDVEQLSAEPDCSSPKASATLDKSGAVGVGGPGVSGHVTITTITTTCIAGTFSVEFGTAGETLSGQFSAVICP